MLIVTREQWGAVPPKTTPRQIPMPTPELWLHHTASPTGYEARVRAIQQFHMQTRGWNDIAYSYLINHEGTIYEGRGAGIAGGHTKNHNTISHAICVLGNYDKIQPSVAALRSVVELARHGFREGWWRNGFTGGHRNASGASTSCPGVHLWKQIPDLNKAITIEEDDMPLTQSDIDHIWYRLITDPITGEQEGAQALLASARGDAYRARVDAAVARRLAEEAAQGVSLTPAQIAAIGDQISTSIADEVADELADRLTG